MVIGGTSIHKYVLYIWISSIYVNNAVVLTLLIFILCYMDPVPLISWRQQSKQLGSHGHMLLGTDLD